MFKVLPPDRVRLERVVRDRNAAEKHVWRWRERFMDEDVEGLLRRETRRSRIAPLAPEVSQRVVALTLPPAQLRSLWRDTYRSPAPDIGPDLLRRGIANRLQERVHGSLTGAPKREIERLRKRVERTGKAGHMHAISLKTGTRLVRSWNCKSYHVLVCDEGLEFEGRHYDSLSHIAREITGAHWSG